MEYPKEPANMPKSVDTRVGCKVAWETYATEEEAAIASDYWRKLAIYKAIQGYDFGYCVPGEIRKVDKGFEVTTP